MDLRDIIYRKIDEAIGSIAQSMSDGHYTIEEYKRASGEVYGLRLALNIISETYREYLAE